MFQYVGFETKGADREYTFTLRGSGGESAGEASPLGDEPVSQLWLLPPHGEPRALTLHASGAESGV